MFCKRSNTSCRTPELPAGTITKATIGRDKALACLFSSSRLCKNKSIPLFLNSYLPLVTTIKLSLGRLGSLQTAAATANSCLRAVWRHCANTSLLGTKASSKPLGVTMSTLFSKNWAHSTAVISLTVVKASAVCADNLVAVVGSNRLVKG